MNQEEQCRNLLSDFLYDFLQLPVQWLPNLSNSQHSDSSSSSSQQNNGESLCNYTNNADHLYCLLQLMDLPYSKLEDSFAEYRLYPDISQLSYTFNQQGQKQYYTLVRSSEQKPFTIQEQLADCSLVLKCPKGIRDVQETFIKSVAIVLPWLQLEPDYLEELDGSNNEEYVKQPLDISASQSEVSVEDTMHNLKNVLQLQLFDLILKPGVDCSIILNIIDPTKLQAGLDGILRAQQEQREKSPW